VQKQTHLKLPHTETREKFDSKTVKLITCIAAAHQKPKKVPAAVPFALQDPLVHLKMANCTETCSVYICNEKRAKNNGSCTRYTEKPDLHSATGCCNIVLIKTKLISELILN
jgi:hypothetical protein